MLQKFQLFNIALWNPSFLYANYGYGFPKTEKVHLWTRRQLCFSFLHRWNHRGSQSRFHSIITSWRMLFSGSMKFCRYLIRSSESLYPAIWRQVIIVNNRSHE